MPVTTTGPTTAERVRSSCARTQEAVLAVEGSAPTVTSVHHLRAGGDFVVAVPTAHHERVGLALADAGIHTLIEKPLAPDVESARRLVDAFESRDLVGAVGHIERYNPALQQARHRMAAHERRARRSKFHVEQWVLYTRPASHMPGMF